MKPNIIKFLLPALIAIFVFSSRETFCQTPTYTLTVTNDAQVSATTYEFDIYLLQTGINLFEYANNSQYFININPAIINGGALTFTILPGTCQLNALQQIPAAKVSFDAVNTRLRIAASSPSGAGTGTIISNISPGIRLGRFRVTNTVSFPAAQPNLSWYNIQSGFYTKVFAYVAGVNVEITDSTGHHVVINNNPLPVTLSEFISSVSRNEVTLSWITTQEVNNSGFEIYRTIKDKNDWIKTGFISGRGTTNEPVNYKFTDKDLQTAVYKYKLKQLDYNGNYEFFNLNNDVTVNKPGSFNISQNYPNPSNPKCKIDYELPRDAFVTVKVYDLLGREVITLVNEMKQAGYYTSEFDGTNLASGIYIYRIKTDYYSATKKMVLVK